MKITGDSIECLQGERWTQELSGFDFNIASQIMVKLAGTTNSLVWLKQPDDEYPAATAITEREDGKMIFTIDTTGLPEGKYSMEARVDVAGVLAPVYKKRDSFITIKKSYT